MAKKKQKLYFDSIDSEMCEPLEYKFTMARIEELKSITVIEAVLDTETNDFIWCTHFGTIVDKGECKKTECASYNSKSGRGVCSERGKLYSHGEEVTFDVPELTQPLAQCAQ